jgi:cytochrome P450
MRNKKLWGDDAKMFRPERWLEGSPEKIRKKDASVDLGFGSGKYGCLGKNIGQIELAKVFVEVRDFCLRKGRMEYHLGPVN